MKYLIAIAAVAIFAAPAISAQFAILLDVAADMANIADMIAAR